ncbi:hypothetical protein [Leeuwenhoekiella marinoflava]|uniref:Uncharacterized protein n=3 Tax=Leeuwenhoekiella marinoflava TaxID=988 RepID=A0A4Q0PPV4_9FLAO|nr:hypothetical protein [Leeuwenhoekiella marinoflava]RXG32636.1 hypothetical protein DSL99_412 [Leeuwenhoekiella marinoflava]SHE51586.1 hypothetical protein SAMN02745246_00471 [Leeuwenhoekiella marinoflava DSM 3653]
MKLREEDKKFVNKWQEKRESKLQFFLGIILQVTLGAITYKLVVSFISTGMFDKTDFISYGIFGFILGVVVAFVKYRMNEKRFKKLKTGK